MSDDLQSYFERQFAELEEMLGEQAEVQDRQAVLDKEIAKRTQKIAQIALSCEDDLDPKSSAARLVRALREGGLSNAIRNIFKAAKWPISAVEIHKELKAIGYPVAGYQNVLATLHLTLKRLSEQGEIRPVEIEGKKAYVWNAKQSKPKWAQQIDFKKVIRVPEEPIPRTVPAEPRSIDKKKD